MVQYFSFSYRGTSFFLAGENDQYIVDIPATSSPAILPQLLVKSQIEYRAGWHPVIVFVKRNTTLTYSFYSLFSFLLLERQQRQTIA